MASTPSSFRRRTARRTSSSFSGATTSPLQSTRSSTSSIRWKGVRGAGGSVRKSYMSDGPSRHSIFAAWGKAMRSR